MRVRAAVEWRNWSRAGGFDSSCRHCGGIRPPRCARVRIACRRCSTRLLWGFSFPISAVGCWRSGGQKQRVALARALVFDPRLFLLDEPLASLDALTRLEMQRLIHDLWWRSGCTAMLVTHDIEEAVTLADRVLFIHSGRIQSEFAYPGRASQPRATIKT